MASTLLPVAHFKESHELKVIAPPRWEGSATIVAPPCQSMAVGDAWTLTINMFFDNGDPWDQYKSNPEILADSDIGKPVRWSLGFNELEIIEGGYGEMSYSIVYATPTAVTRSEEQRIDIVPPSSPLLAPPAIKGFDGDTLDPEAYPDGATLIIPLWPGIQFDDWVLLYAMGDTQVLKTVRVDQSTIDSEILEITLDYEWLAANNGNDVNLMYQFARVGSAGTSTPLSLTLRKPLYLPLPIIEGVLRDPEDGVHEGYLLGRSVTNGVYITLPEEAVIGERDTRQLIWDGHVNGGRYVADPTVGNPKRFQVPKQYMPANLGKRLWVFYEVTPPGEDAYTSKRFNLEIKDMETGWPVIQIISPPAPNNKLSLATVTTVVTLRLNSWTWMEQGQHVKISVTGVLQAGGKETLNVREGIREVVSEEEYYAGELQVELPRAFLIKLKLNEQFDVVVETSFDKGVSYKAFPMIFPQLVA